MSSLYPNCVAAQRLPCTCTCVFCFEPVCDHKAVAVPSLHGKLTFNQLTPAKTRSVPRARSAALTSHEPLTPGPMQCDALQHKQRIAPLAWHEEPVLYVFLVHKLNPGRLVNASGDTANTASGGRARRGDRTRTAVTAPSLLPHLRYVRASERSESAPTAHDPRLPTPTTGSCLCLSGDLGGRTWRFFVPSSRLGRLKPRARGRISPARMR